MSSLCSLSVGALWLAGCTTPNAGPVLVPPADLVVSAGDTLTVDLDVSDPDGDAVTLALVTAPSDATLDGKNLTWTPDAADVGVTAFVVSATDDADPPATAYAAFSVTVPAEEPPVNEAPSLDALDDVTLSLGDDLEVVLSASDPDGDTLAFAIESAPDDAALSADTVTWTPTANDLGSHAFLVSVTDDGIPPLDDQALFVVTVVDPDAPPANHPPVADPVEDREVDVGEALTVVLAASDPDPWDTLTWDDVELPPGASFVAATATLSWTPASWDVGTHYAHLRVEDDGVPMLHDDVLVRIDVLAPPSGPPQFTQVPAEADWEPCVGHQADFTAVDPDGTPVTLYIANAPDGVTLTELSQSGGTTSARLAWTPNQSQEGLHQIPVYAVEDQTNITTVVTFTVVVSTSPAPEVESFVEMVGGDSAVLAQFDNCYSAVFTGLPDSWEWDPGTREISWPTTPDDFGIYDVEYTFTNSEVPPVESHETSRVVVEFFDDLDSLDDYSTFAVFQPGYEGDHDFEVIEDVDALDGWVAHSYSAYGANVTGRAYRILGGAGEPLAAVSYDFRAHGVFNEDNACGTAVGHLGLFDFAVTDPGGTWTDYLDFQEGDAAFLRWIPFLYGDPVEYLDLEGFGELPEASSEVTLALTHTDHSNACSVDVWWDRIHLVPHTETPIEVEIDWKADCPSTVLKASDLPAGTYRLTALESAASVYSSGHWNYSIHCEGLEPADLHTVNAYYDTPAQAWADLVTYEEDVPFAGGDLMCGIPDSACSDNHGSIRFRMAWLHP